jgi:hypothetical protein
MSIGGRGAGSALLVRAPHRSLFPALKTATLSAQTLAGSSPLQAGEVEQ